ncbi:MAG: penicillin-binding transpeptidase domain-containing protein [bacterium]|nr:penicillin-binding transpeptidase domain-containing protein [bacterium]
MNKEDFASPIGKRIRRKPPIIRLILLAALLMGAYYFLKDRPQEPDRLHSDSVADSELIVAAEPQKQAGQELEAIVTVQEELRPAPASWPGFEEAFLTRQTDKKLAGKLLEVLKSQNPYAGFYLMVDVEGGEILAWGQQEGFSAGAVPSYMSKSDFPAASLAKIITAAAALESRRYSNHTKIPLIGSSVTLYKRQLEVPKRYSGKRVTLERSFASSMNPSMAIVGMGLGGGKLQHAAEKLGFNYPFPNAVPETSFFRPPSSGFGLAEFASGFTTKATLSPLLAAAIVRSVLKGESPQLPWSPLVGLEYAHSSPSQLNGAAFSKNTYYGLRRMFEATVKSGSARSIFDNDRTFYPGNRKRLRVGGKTGTKNGGDLRYEWFAGYAQDRKDPSRGVVVICLHMNKSKGTRASHPAQAAALLINHWAKDYVQW